jgi:ATP-binding protein involved in chromosome partitioning
MTLVDPRTAVIEERMRGIKRIIAVSSGKGGVGKSLVASTTALALAQRGLKVGLFDLDFTSPSTHLVLGAEGVKPKERKGIVPPLIDGLKYMSIVYYSGANALPLRGEDTSNALVELFSVTQWGKLDFLVLDMPPGIGDATLDLIRLIRRIEFLVVTVPSVLAFETVRKLVGLLAELKIPLLGVVENMKRAGQDSLGPKVKKMGIEFYGEIHFDNKIEEAIGNKDVLMRTAFAREVKRVADKIFA